MKKFTFTITLLACAAFMIAGAAVSAADDKKKTNPSEYMETYVGDAVADALADAMKTEAALINGGSLGYEDLPDRITNKTLSQLVPFATDMVVAVEIKGEYLLDILEKSVSLLPRRSSSFLQVSGISFTCNPNLKPGYRVIGATVGGKKLDPEKSYEIATTDFLASGGGGMAAFRKGELMDKEPKPLNEVILDHIRYNKNEIGDPAGRIRIMPFIEEN